MPQVRSISDASRPTSWQCSSRISFLALNASASPNPCHMSPYCATSFNVTFGPLPPIRIGSLPSGGGLSLPRRSLIRGSACAQRPHAVGRGAELVAVLVVVALEPAGADAEDRAAAGDVVDRAVRVGQQLRVAVGVADHQRADLRALGDLRHRAERRDRLEVLAVRVAGEREEVVPAEDRVDAELLRLEPGAAHAVEVGVLGLDLDTYANRSHIRTLDRPIRRIGRPSATIRAVRESARGG